MKEALERSGMKKKKKDRVPALEGEESPSALRLSTYSTNDRDLSSSGAGAAALASSARAATAVQHAREVFLGVAKVLGLLSNLTNMDLDAIFSTIEKDVSAVKRGVRSCRKHRIISRGIRWRKCSRTYVS